MSDGKERVVVTDIQMSFGSMVVFMVKWAIASIPAMIILGLIGGLFWILIELFTLGGGSSASQLARAEEDCKGSPDTTCMRRHGFYWDNFKWVPLK